MTDLILGHERWQRLVTAVLWALLLLAVSVWIASPLLQAALLGPEASIRVWRPAALATGFLILAVWVARKRPRLLHAYFGAEGSAVNLAVFRIVLFGLLLTSENVSQALRYSRLPDLLQYPPVGLAPVLDVLPVNERLVTSAALLFVAAAACALIGLYTRPAALATTLLGLYVLGVPQFYGKVNHYHHLLWFAAILAVSRCGDALSVDALRRGWRDANAGRPPARPGSARAYALPLRFVWLLMGLVYFFPGFWKFVVSGPGWAIGDNVRDLMYAKWMALGGWQPWFPIDQYPLLYQAAGVGTLLFELLFVVFILFPQLRNVAAITGFVFHTTTLVFMRISFFTLQALYVSFVDWERIAARLGRRWHRYPLRLRYNPGAVWQRRIAGLVCAADVFSVVVVEARSSRDLELDTGRGLSTDAAAVVSLVRWLPPLWWVAPVLLIAGVRRALDERLSRADDAVSPVAPAAASSRRWQPVVAVGVFLLVVNSAAGVVRLLDAWPFAVYPLFASRAPQEVSTLAFELENGAGERIVLSRSDLGTGLPAERLTGLVSKILADEDEARQRQRLEALLLSGDGTVFNGEDVRSVTFYRDTVATAPDRQDANPLERQRLAHLDMGGRAIGAGG